VDALRDRVAPAAGALVAAAGAASWALAATSMAAVQAAEARALGPGHTAEVPGEDELALVAHDARLAALVVVACGLAIALARLPRRVATAAWLGGAVALVVANATLGRAVDGGLLALVPQLLAVPVLVGGGLGVAVTAPAGAYVNYDGLPVVGGGLVLGAAVLAVCVALRGPAVAPPERSEVLTDAR